MDTVSLVPDGWASECFKDHVSERPKKVVKYVGRKTATSYPKKYPQYMKIADGCGWVLMGVVRPRFRQERSPQQASMNMKMIVMTMKNGMSISKRPWTKRE